MTRTILDIQSLSVGTYSPHIDCYSTSDVSSHRRSTPSIIFPHRSLASPASPASFVLSLTTLSGEKKLKKKTQCRSSSARAQPDGRGTEGTSWQRASARSLITLEPRGRLMGPKEEEGSWGQKRKCRVSTCRLHTAVLVSFWKRVVRLEQEKNKCTGSLGQELHIDS